MKIILLCIFILSSGFIYSQEEIPEIKYHGAFTTLLINHSPSARAEAMGKGMVANNEGNYGSYYNPALTSLSTGFTSDFSYSEAHGDKPSLSYYGVSYSNKKSGSFGISAYYFSKEQDDVYWYQQKYSGGYYDAIYTVNYSREVAKDFFAGVNLGVYHYSNYFYNFIGFDEPVIDDGVTVDLGLLKKFNIKTSANKQMVQLGAALYNITNSKISHTDDYSEYKDPLPVIFRFGASHQIKFSDGLAADESDLFSFFTHAEYENFLNSKFDVTFKLGEEFTVKDIVSLRIGYYYSEVGDADYYGGYQSEFSAGIGVNIPLNKILKTKNIFNIKIDFASIAPQKTVNIFFITRQALIIILMTITKPLA